jgi:prophage antirepressor-like protein
MTGMRKDPRVILLTEPGVYRLLFISRTRAAEEFRAYVCKLLHDIRLKSAVPGVEEPVPGVEEPVQLELYNAASAGDNKKILSIRF